MASKKLGPEDWAKYLELYAAVEQDLKGRPWFAAGWEVRKDFLGDRAAPRGVWLQLIKTHWFDGNLHIETWLNNGVMDSGRLTVALHAETSIPKHGISRNAFSSRFLERIGDSTAVWEGWATKPAYAMEPISVKRSFTTETIRPILVEELTRFAGFGAVIDEVIEEVRQ